MGVYRNRSVVNSISWNRKDELKNHINLFCFFTLEYSLKMASRRKNPEFELSSITTQEVLGDDKGGKSSRSGTCWSFLSRISLMTLKIELKSTRFLFLYMAVCFSLAFLFILNSSAGPTQDHVGYPVVDDEKCGTDEERVLNVFAWAKQHGAYINHRVSTGLFPIPGKNAILRPVAALSSK